MKAISQEGRRRSRKSHRSASKIILNVRDLSNEMHLKEYGLTTLTSRRLRRDQMEMLRILKGDEYIDTRSIFS